MSNESTKSAVFTHIRESLENLKREYNAEFQIVIYTAFGRIVCDLKPPSTKNALLGFVDDPTTVVIDISAVFDETGMFDAQLLNAKNVVIYNNNSGEEPIRVEQMVLFTDQILGFSLERRWA